MNMTADGQREKVCGIQAADLTSNYWIVYSVVYLLCAVKVQYRDPLVYQIPERHG